MPKPEQDVNLKYESCWRPTISSFYAALMRFIKDILCDSVVLFCLYLLASFYVALMRFIKDTCDSVVLFCLYLL